MNFRLHASKGQTIDFRLKTFVQCCQISKRRNFFSVNQNLIFNDKVQFNYSQSRDGHFDRRFGLLKNFVNHFTQQPFP